MLPAEGQCLHFNGGFGRLSQTKALTAFHDIMKMEKLLPTARASGLGTLQCSMVGRLLPAVSVCRALKGALAKLVQLHSWLTTQRSILDVISLNVVSA